MIFLIDEFIKFYQVTDFINKLITAKNIFKREPISFYQLLCWCKNTPKVLTSYERRTERSLGVKIWS